MTENQAPNAAVLAANERKHHPFSPSQLQVLEVSPAYVGEQSTNTEASEAGTLQHYAAESTTDLDDPRLEDAQHEAVMLCKGYRDDILAKYPGGTVIKEEYLRVDNKVLKLPSGECWAGTSGGYLDLAVISADQKVAEICDWKFGMWSVEPAETNLQGIAYLLGLVVRYPSLESVTVHFVMPHRNEIEQHTFTRDQFPALLLRVQTVVARAYEARYGSTKGQCNATISSCLFCGNKGTCGTLAAFALKVGKKYAPAVVPAELTPSLFSNAETATEAMGVAQLLNAWSIAVRTQITAKAIDSEDWLPGGYVLRTRSNSEVTDWWKLAKFARKAGVPKAALREALSITVTPLNKAIRALAARGDKEAAQQEFKRQLIEAGLLEEKPPTIFLERIKT